MKKFRACLCLWIFAIFLSHVSSISHALPHTKMPVLNYVGIVPVQFKNLDDVTDPRIKAKFLYLEKSITKGLSQTKRFELIHPELVKQHWASVSGRKLLNDRYALSAYVVLDIDNLGDSVQVTLRFLGPELQPYLQEGKTWSGRDFLSFSKEDLDQQLSKLVFRLSNRIPIDVNVTSIQGRYLTLSGGMDQGLGLGDALQLVRANVADVHPVLLTWRSFALKPLGTARIIEIRESVAIAELTNLVEEGLVEVGDGAKSHEIAGRRQFHVKQKDGKFAKEPSSSIVVSPLYKSGVKLAQNQNVLIKEADAPDLSNVDKESKAKKNGTSIAVEPELDTDKSFNPFSMSDSIGEIFEFDIERPKLDDVIANLADDIAWSFGLGGWSYQGPGAIGSKASWYLPLNMVGARITRQIVPSIKYGIGGGLGLGKTQGFGGSFTSYDGHVRLYWESKQRLLDGLITTVMTGGHAAFTGIGVKQSGFGGYDVIMGGVFVGAKGEVRIPTEKTVYDWFFELNLTPLTLGRIGYDRKQRFIRSSLGWKSVWGIYQRAASKSAELGFGWSYAQQSILDVDSIETEMTHYSLFGLSRWKF